MAHVKTVVADASVLLKAYLRDESDVSSVDAMLQDLSDGRLRIAAPSLMRYEIANALWAAARQGRIVAADAITALQAFLQIDIDYYESDDILTGALNFAQQYGRSVYDSAYVALAQRLGVWFFTGDRRLHNALSPHLGFLRWIGDYQYESLP
ncbi:MAG: type II toxin-antitoxin system VapC family toxin [Fimbriimonadales bacterium]|nr:type II toxin-antitoxin system VapC family toxin [Fimbriimonadales bacterium]